MERTETYSVDELSRGIVLDHHRGSLLVMAIAPREEGGTLERHEREDCNDRLMRVL